MGDKSSSSSTVTSAGHGTEPVSGDDTASEGWHSLSVAEGRQRPREAKTGIVIDYCGSTVSPPKGRGNAGLLPATRPAISNLFGGSSGSVLWALVAASQAFLFPFLVELSSRAWPPCPPYFCMLLHLTCYGHAVVFEP